MSVSVICCMTCVCRLPTRFVTPLCSLRIGSFCIVHVLQFKLLLLAHSRARTTLSARTHNTLAQNTSRFSDHIDQGKINAPPVQARKKHCSSNRQQVQMSENQELNSTVTKVSCSERDLAENLAKQVRSAR